MMNHLRFRFVAVGLLPIVIGILSALPPTLEIERSGNDILLRFPSDPDSYYIVRGSTSPEVTDTPVGMVLGDGLQQTLIEAGVLASLPEQQFYQLEKLPRDNPKDTDEDGINDVLELDYAFLDPLNPADAALDFDGDGFTNLEELVEFDSDPEEDNLPILPPRILGLSFQAAKETLELAGLRVGATSCQPTVHHPAVAVISPDLSPYVAVPANAAIDLTISLPLDANLFIDQRNLTAFDGSEANTLAYYAAVDPLNDRTTLLDWIAVNGFGGAGGSEAQAAYFNEADLGFGRRMSMRQDANGIAYYTVNYLSVDEAALGPQTDVATVCMEFAPHPTQGGEPYVKFFTYNGNHPDPAKRANPNLGPGVRLNSINLDTRGEKFQPGMCMTCHGGTPRELDNGVYPDLGRIGARFIPFDVDSFTYPSISGFSRADQEAEFKTLNETILASIPEAKKFTFTGQEDIPDASGQGVDAGVTVTNFTGTIADLNFSFDGIGPCSTINGDQNNGLSHPDVRDLVVNLTSPDGTTVTLLSRQFPLGTSNFCRMELNDEASRPISDAFSAEAPYSGLWKPLNPLSAFDGENPNGLWIINVRDEVSGNIGSVNQFSLHITPSVREGAVSELIEGWYGGAGLPNGTFDESFVPPGWLTPSSLTEGGDEVYREVVAKSCRACHVMLTDRRPDLDFDAYAEFAGRRFAVESYVFDRGMMPMAKRTFDKFWMSTSPSQPEILAAWIDAPNQFSYLGAPQAIPDLGSGSSSVTLSTLVSGFTGIVEDLDFSFGGTGPCSRDAGDTNNGLTHSFVSDLRVTLTSPPPSSISVRLLDRVGGDGINFCSMRLDDEAQISLVGITGTQAPFPGSWHPSQALSAFDGIDPNGVWELKIEDLAASDTGSVQDWALHFNSLGATSGPGAPVATVSVPMIVEGVNTVTLDGSGSLFADSYEWTLITPQGTILNPNSPTATLQFAAQGTYTVSLTVRSAFGKSVVAKDITLVNQAPVITSITRQSPVRFPAASRLAATYSDDQLPNPPASQTFLWEKASGPGEVFFDDPGALTTVASFSKPGTYLFCLTISDGDLDTTAQVTVVSEEEMVTIGNTSNAPDPATGFGSVAYNYRIGQFEVTNAQYATFLNAVASASDPYELFNINMDANLHGSIARTGSAPNFVYFAKNDRDDLPVNFVSFFDAVRYVNWLHNGATPGDETEDGAYTLLGGTPLPSNADTVTRNAGAKRWVPSVDEWYKAGFHQPFGSGGDSDDYWAYGTGSNTEPSPSVPPGTPPSANYTSLFATPSTGPTPVGSYTGSETFYGTSDQVGNVWEILDTILLAGEFGTFRRAGGGGFDNSPAVISATTTVAAFAQDAISPTYGMRIAGTPEGIGGNVAPNPNAGSYPAVAGTTTPTLPITLTLAGSVSDDGLPAPPSLTTTWTQVSAPAGAPTENFTDASSLNSTVTFQRHGDYVLRLTANDGELSNFSEVPITVLVSFKRDLAPMLTTNCLSCHNDLAPNGAFSIGTDFTTPKSCADILLAVKAPGTSRVDLANPTLSKILTYPAVGGGTMLLQANFGTSSDNYHKILTWIQQGALDDCNSLP